MYNKLYNPDKKVQNTWRQTVKKFKCYARNNTFIERPHQTHFKYENSSIYLVKQNKIHLLQW